MLTFIFSGRSCRLWGNLGEEGSGRTGGTSFAKLFFVREWIWNYITLTGSVGNERLSAADVVERDEDHADQVLGIIQTFLQLFFFGSNGHNVKQWETLWLWFPQETFKACVPTEQLPVPRPTLHIFLHHHATPSSFSEFCNKLYSAIENRRVKTRRKVRWGLSCWGLKSIFSVVLLPVDVGT